MAHRLPLADIQFIADFAAYARKRGDEGYDYNDSGRCACGQFLKASGRAEQPSVGSSIGWADLAGRTMVRTPLPSGVDEAAFSRPHTFSALADRLDALLADAPEVVKA